VKTLRKWYNRFFGTAGAALPCTKPSYLWSVYHDYEGWMFTYFNEDHTRGEVRGPFFLKELAMDSAARWASANTNAILIEDIQ